MRSVLLRSLLLVLLPVAVAVVAWTLTRPSRQPPSGPPPALPVVHEAERRPIEPGHGVAAMARPAADPSADATWIDLNNEATTDLTRGDLDVAVEKLQRCHDARPDNAVFLANLVESLVRLARHEHEDGRLADAIEHLERAIRLGTARPDLDVLQRVLERWKRERELGENDWTDDGSARFELAFDRDRADLLHHSYEVLEHLERCYDDLVAWFELDPLEGAPRTRVVLYEPGDFDRLTGLGDWAAGVFDGVVRISVQDLTASDDWRYVLRHELVHVFVQAIAGSNVPGWLNEGLAQLLEQRAWSHPSLLTRLGSDPPYTLAELGGSLAGWQDSRAIGRAYAESLLFVSYLQATYGEEALRRILTGLGHGLDAAHAFQEWSSVPLETAFGDWTVSLGR